MDIYNLSNKMHEESEMLQVLGLENVGFRFAMDGDEYASCTCGCFKRINKKYGREHIFDYTRIHENNKIVARCEKCGNPYFYDIDYNEEEISTPIKFQPTVVANTNKYFVLRIVVYSVKSVLNELTMNDDNEFYFVYDKVNDDLFIAEDDSCGTIDVQIDNYTVHLEKCKLSDIFGWNDCFIDVNYDAEFYSLVGFEEIVKLVCDQTGQTLDSDDMTLELSYVLGSLALYTKIKYLPHLKREIKNGRPLRKFLLNRFYGIDEISTKLTSLERYGIDYTKSTLEEAFGVDIDFLSTCDGCDGFKRTAPFNKLVISENLQEYISENANNLDDTNKERIFELYTLARNNEQVSNFETFIKHIVRAVNNGTKINDILIVLDKILSNSEEYTGLIDFTKPFSKSILTKKAFVDYDILTLGEYEKFLQKPTIDTMYKLLQQH